MNSSVILSEFGMTVAIVLGLVFWRFRRARRETDEPRYELEKLTNCISCGSLIPEGVRRCAFCGSWQRKDASGE